jgi:hypothetical protein
MPKSKVNMELVALQMPKELKQKLEEYAQNNGYNLSYAIRKCVESQLLTSNFTWQDFIEWRNKTNETLLEMLKIEKAMVEWKGQVYEILEHTHKAQENTANYLDKINVQIQTLDFQIEVLFRILEKLTGQPIRQILAETLEEWKAKKKAEKGDEKNE